MYFADYGNQETMQSIINSLKNLTVITGHFGSGKTNLAVGIARSAASLGRKVTIIDLDIVNPYFRAADNVSELEALGVKCIVPDFASTNVDIPTLPPSVMGALESHEREPDRLIILDVGGDNGAVALGMYKRFFKEGDYDLLYAVNKYRPLTEDIHGAVDVLREIEYLSRLTATGIVNTSNLGDETSAEDVLDTDSFAKELAGVCGLPLVCTVAREELISELSHLPNVFPIKNATKMLF